jgi:hypothetical protein
MEPEPRSRTLATMTQVTLLFANFVPGHAKFFPPKIRVIAKSTGSENPKFTSMKVQGALKWQVFKEKWGLANFSLGLIY